MIEFCSICNIARRTSLVPLERAVLWVVCLACDTPLRFAREDDMPPPAPPLPRHLKGVIR